MMTQDEIKRRNIAITLFDGWDKKVGHAGIGVFYTTIFNYHTDWNALMLVVEKMELEGITWLEIGTDVYGKYVAGRLGKHYWHVFDLVQADLERLNITSSLREAYFMAVSDCFLSVQGQNRGDS